MKITHNKVGQNLNLTDAGKGVSKNDKAKNTNSTSSTANSEATSGLKDIGFQNQADSAQVALSSKAQDILKAQELAQSTPDIDMDKVEKFQKLIDSGKYKVDAKAVAERMVDEHLMMSGLNKSEE